MKLFFAPNFFNTLKLKLLFNILSIAFFFFTNFVQAQLKTDKTYQGKILDEYTVKAMGKGFDAIRFIQFIKYDSTFYKAFKSLHIVAHTLYNDIEITAKDKETVKAKYTSVAIQRVQNGCRSMKIENEKVRGNFFTRKGKYTYYTAKLYAALFFTQGTICNENNIVSNKISQGENKYINQLKQLIFNPGASIKGIPGVSDKVAIFEEPMLRCYKFSLLRTILNNEECFLFTAKPFEKYKDNVVINELQTWFRVSDYSIVARNYSLSYRTLAYDFDVVMKVKLTHFKNFLVPYEVVYNGNWHVFTKPREIVNFTALFSDFK